MLDTVLQIGKAFRHSDKNLKYHRYIKQCPQDSDKLKILRLSVPVRDDFTFDFDLITEIKDENIIKNDLYYLTFKTSDSDTSIKYVFGDIYYRHDKKTKKEVGNYRTILHSKYSAFERAEQYLSEISSDRIKNFRVMFKNQRNQIEKLLFTDVAIFIHFDFQTGFRYWYDNKDLEKLNRIMISQFTDEIKHENFKAYSFKTMLYRTLCSGDQKNDIQFPNFDVLKKFKSKYFDLTEVENLFYAIDYTEKPTIKPSHFFIGAAKEKLKIIVLPKGISLTAEDYSSFSLSREEVIKVANESKEIDWLFAPVTELLANEIIAFDVIFVKEGQNVDSDVIEISGLEKSYLQKLNHRIERIKANINEEAKRNMHIVGSFLNILGDDTNSKKKYQNHLLKVLPKIYSGTYYQDPILLPIFVEKVEHSIRKSEANYNFLKYDFYFLITIQNTKKEGENIMKIKDSQSYKIGQLLGKLAQNFAGKNSPIKSFEKNYVGNLSRRINTIADLIKFKTHIEEKIIIHDKSFPNVRETSLKLTEAIKEFSDRYDRNECAFGFFESYFAPFEQKKTDENQSEN